MDVPFDQSQTVCFIISISEGRTSEGIFFSDGFELLVCIDRNKKKKTQTVTFHCEEWDVEKKNAKYQLAKLNW